MNGRGGRAAALVAAVLLAVLAAPACSGGLEEPPEVIRGTWEAQEGRWAGRSFRITAESLILDRGEAGEASYPISEVQVDSEGGVEIYTVRYRDRGETSEFTVRRPPDADFLRVQHRPDVRWEPAGSGDGGGG